MQRGSGASGRRAGGEAGWRAEGCAAKGGGAAAAETPSLMDGAEGAGDEGAPAALPPGAALGPLLGACECGIGKGEAVRQGEAGNGAPSPHSRWYVRYCVLVSSRRLSACLPNRLGAQAVVLFRRHGPATRQNGQLGLISPSNAGGFAVDITRGRQANLQHVRARTHWHSESGWQPLAVENIPLKPSHWQCLRTANVTVVPVPRKHFQ